MTNDQPIKGDHRMKRAVTCLAAVSIICLMAAAALTQQSVAKTIAIKCGRLIDVRSGAVVNQAVIVIEGERITAVGSQVAIPANAEVIDLGRMTVLPGLIDCHTHLTRSEERRVGKE